MQPVPREIRFCTSHDGTRIAYEISGKGPPLVWIQHWVHHLESDWDSPVWQPWLTFLSQSHMLIRFDWRGCGLSDRDPVEFSFERYVEDLAAVIDANAVARFPLFGMAGAGSGVALAYASRHSERVSALVLQESHTRGRIAGRPDLERIEEAEARLKVIELGWHNDARAYAEFFAELHIPESTGEQRSAYNALLRGMTTSANAIALLRSFWQVDIRGLIPAVTCPSLVVHAQGDSVIPFAEGRKVASLLSASRFLPLDSRNHLLLATEPEWDRFIMAVTEFFSTFERALQRPSFAELTAREREILNLVAQGYDNRRIGASLGISEKTVRNHVSIILDKLRVNRRSQAIVLAREHRFGVGPVAKSAH